MTVYLQAAERAALMIQLAAIPSLLRDLDVTLVKQHKFAAPGPTGHGSRGAGLLFHAGASKAIDALEVVLRVFAAQIGGGRVTPDEPAGRARWLRLVLPDIPGTDPRLSGMAAAVRAAFDQAMAAVDRPLDRIYLGLCSCGVALNVEAGQARVQCGRCGAVVSVAEKRERMLESARYRVGTAGELARLLPWFADIQISEATIIKAGQRGKIPRLQFGSRGVLFRLGDVVDYAVSRHAPAKAL